MSQLFPGVNVFAEVDMAVTEDIPAFSCRQELQSARKPDLEDYDRGIYQQESQRCMI